VPSTKAIQINKKLAHLLYLLAVLAQGFLLLNPRYCNKCWICTYDK